MTSGARLTGLCAAEWTKLWSLRSAPVSFGLSVAFGLYVVGYRSGLPGGHDAAFDAALWSLLMIGAGLAGAQSLAGEYASGLIRTTLLAVPDRRRLALAKAIVVATVAAAVALILAVGGIGVAHFTAPARPGAGGGALRAIGASVLVLPVCALAGLALAAVVRHAAGTGFAVCALLGFGPLLLRPGGNRWATLLAEALPYYAWARLARAGTMTVGAAWSVLAAWAAASLLLTVVVLDRRDL